MIERPTAFLRLPPLLSRAVILCALTMLTLFAYWGIHHHEFLNFDDNMYLTANPNVKNGFSWDGIRYAFGFTDVSYWQPLPFLSHMLDSQLFGLEPGPHLLVNLLMHTLNVLLLYLILARMTGAPVKSALVASLFAVHPLNVESVAWLAERKTVLSTLFFFSAILAYMGYARRKRNWRYGLLLCLYALGLMTKPPILTLPALLLLLDYWPLRRFESPPGASPDPGPGEPEPALRYLSRWISTNRPILLEKAPLFMLSAASLVITMMSVVHQEMVVDQQMVPLYLRLYNLVVSVMQYLHFMVWPVELSIFYPFPRTIYLTDLALSLTAVLLITWGAFVTRQKRPWLIVGWCWFLIALSPASGVIQAGLWPGIANRFMYIPMIGLFVMLIWEGDARLQGRYSLFLKAVLCGALLVYFAALTKVQNNYFSNSFSLFTRSLEVVGENELALNNLGVALTSLGRQDEALACFARSIQRNPAQANAHHNYGVCLVAKGDEAAAVPHFEKAIALNPRLVNPHVHLGLIRSNQGDEEGAAAFLKKAMDLDPNNLDVRNNYGTVLSNQRRFEEAIPYFLFVLRKDPGHVQARINLSQAYEEAGRYDEAIAEYRVLDKVIRHRKGYIYYRMARVRSQQKLFAECSEFLEKARKDGFDVAGLIVSDKGFAPFRQTEGYRRFLETRPPQPQDGAAR